MEAAKREDQIFLSRKFWVPDESAKYCFDCGAKFMPPFKRRHHCRMCGKVFCSKCTNNFLEPPEFVFEKEKEIRVCNHCFKLSQNIIKKLNHSDILVNFSRSARKKNSLKFTSPMESFSHALKESPLFSLNMVLSYHLSVLIEDTAERAFKEAGVDPEWIELLRDLIIQALDDVQPDTVDGVDSMDITKYIKIKKIPYQDDSETKYIQGIALRKNIPHKRMSNEILNPRILMISGALDFKDSQDYTNLGSLVEEEKEQAKSIVKSIMKVQPDILVVEKTVDWGIQELLRQNGVTLVFKLRPSQFGRICRVTGAKFIDNLKFLNEDPDKFLGTCALFKVMNLNNHEYFEKAHNYEKGTLFDPTIMKFDGCNHAKGVTITISGPDYAELQTVKRCLFKCFRILRNSVIEKEVILQEIFLYYTKEEVIKALALIQTQNESKIKENEDLLMISEEEIKNEPQISYNQYFGISPTTVKRKKFSNLHLLNEATVRSAGFFLDFQDVANLQEDLDHPKNKTSKFTKVNLVILSQEGDLEGMRKDELSVLEARLLANEERKVDHLAQICSNPIPKISDFYSKDDTSLGDFIKKKAELLLTKCEECNRPRYHHTSFFYKNFSYVKVSVEAVGPARQTMKRELQKFLSKKHEHEVPRSNGRQKTAIPTSATSDAAANMRRSTRRTFEETKSEGSFLKIFRVFGGTEDSPSNGKKNHQAEDLDSPRIHRFNTSSTINSQSPSHRDQDKRTKISMYLECNGCQKKVSDEFELSRVYLEYSFTKFLSHLISSHAKNEFGQPASLDSPGLVGPSNTLLSLDIDSPATPKAQMSQKFNRCCRESSKSRVFKYQEFLIKFTVGSNKVYSEIEFNHLDGFVQTVIENANLEQIKLKAQRYTAQFQLFIDFILPHFKGPIDFLIQKYKFDPNISEMTLLSEILGKGGSSNSDVYFLLLKELLIAKQKLLQIRDKINEEFLDCPTYLNIEEVRKIVFFQVADLCEKLHKAREDFLSPPKNEKNPVDEVKLSTAGLRRNSISQQKKRDMFKSAPKKSDASENMSESRLSSRSSKSSLIVIERAQSPGLGKIGTEKSSFNNGISSFQVDEVPKEEMRRSTEQTTDDPLNYFKKVSDPETGQDVFQLEFTEDIAQPLVNIESVFKSSLIGRRNTRYQPKILTSMKSIGSENDAMNPKHLFDIGVELKKSSSFNSGYESERASILERSDYSATTPKKIASFQMKKAKDTEDEKECELIRELTRGLCCSEEDDENESYQLFDMIPVNDMEPLSAIAYTLNSSIYMKEVFYSQKFNLLESQRKIPDSKEFVTEVKEKLFSTENRLFMLKIKPQELLFRGYKNILADLHKGLPTSGQNRQQAIEFIQNISELIDIGVMNAAQRLQLPYVEKITFSQFKVSIYYPQQFQALRLMLGITHADFVQSIASSKHWKDNTGGKTQAPFLKSHDNLYVFKTLKKAELNSYMSIVFNYFEYMWKSMRPDSNTRSFLGRIVGIFDLQIKGTKTKHYYIAMENIQLGITPTRVYDLKGSDLNRLVLNPKPGQVRLDTNLKLDQNGEPLSIESSKMKQIMTTLDSDTAFLASMNRVDYSLVLALDDTKKKFKMGIIDYLQDYDLWKQGENFVKSVFNNVAPTIVNAQEYRLRFMRAIERYFMETFIEENKAAQPIEDVESD